MHLFVGRENCSGSNIPQNRVFQDWLPHSPLVVWNDLYKESKLVCYWICECAKNVFSHFLAILGQIPSFWLPWQRAIN